MVIKWLRLIGNAMYPTCACAPVASTSCSDSHVVSLRVRHDKRSSKKGRKGSEHTLPVWQALPLDQVPHCTAALRAGICRHDLLCADALDLREWQGG